MMLGSNQKTWLETQNKSMNTLFIHIKELLQWLEDFKTYSKVVFAGKDSKFHKYHVIREDKPSNTIPAHLYKDGLRHIHPDPNQARTITVREAGRIQTFDDDFEFLGSRGDQYKMIGNAVPPLFSKIIAETIVLIFSNEFITKKELEYVLH